MHFPLSEKVKVLNLIRKKISYGEVANFSMLCGAFKKRVK